MKNLTLYEIKKHIKLIVGLMIIIVLISMFNAYYIKSGDYVQNSSIYESAKNLIALFSFVFVRLLLFGLFIYFITDFINNLFGDERNFLFSIPIKSSQYFLSKILSVSLLVALIYGFIAILNFINFENLLLDFNPLVNNKYFLNLLRGVLSFYSVCLVALLLGYMTILIFKKQLEKTRFIFLWILPFSLIFSIYFAFISQAFYTINDFFITPSNWTLIIINLFISIILFIINCNLLDKKVDI